MAKFMRFVPISVFILVALVLGAQLIQGPSTMTSALIGKPVPSFSLLTLHEQTTYTKSELPKGAYLINFWGTWCPACHIEHPFLMELAEQGVAIIGIDYKDQPKAAQQWLEQKGNPYQVTLMDELGHFGLDMGVTGAPETFVVDANGIIVYRHQGELNLANWQTIKGYLL
ncbi:DsbE family thiol:disulfide interchange protein [Marinomonas epiphytica]